MYFNFCELFFCCVCCLLTRTAPLCCRNKQDKLVIVNAQAKALWQTITGYLLPVMIHWKHEKQGQAPCWPPTWLTGIWSKLAGKAWKRPYRVSKSPPICYPCEVTQPVTSWSEKKKQSRSSLVGSLQENWWWWNRNIWALRWQLLHMDIREESLSIYFAH